VSHHDARQRILARAEATDDPTDLTGTSLSPTQRRIVEAALHRAAEDAAWDRARAEARQPSREPSRPSPVSAPGGGLDPHGVGRRGNYDDFRTWLMWLEQHG
jgi:hypothetical protein